MTPFQRNIHLGIWVLLGATVAALAMAVLDRKQPGRGQGAIPGEERIELERIYPDTAGDWAMLRWENMRPRPDISIFHSSCQDPSNVRALVGRIHSLNGERRIELTAGAGCLKLRDAVRGEWIMDLKPKE